VIYEVEHEKSTEHFKWHNGGVTVSTIWNVNIKWELRNKRLTFRWNFIRDITASGDSKCHRTEQHTWLAKQIKQTFILYKG